MRQNRTPRGLPTSDAGLVRHAAQGSQRRRPKKARRVPPPRDSRRGGDAVTAPGLAEERGRARDLGGLDRRSQGDLRPCPRVTPRELSQRTGGPSRGRIRGGRARHTRPGEAGPATGRGGPVAGGGAAPSGCQGPALLGQRGIGRGRRPEGCKRRAHDESDHEHPLAVRVRDLRSARSRHPCRGRRPHLFSRPWRRVVAGPRVAISLRGERGARQPRASKMRSATMFSAAGAASWPPGRAQRCRSASGTSGGARSGSPRESLRVFLPPTLPARPPRAGGDAPGTSSQTRSPGAHRPKESTWARSSESTSVRPTPSCR